MDIKKMRTQTGMTQKAFGEYFNIPVRTLQDWEAKKRTPPVYVAELIKYKIEKERLNMLKLTELREGGEIGIEKTGTLDEIVEFLKENEDLYDWILDEDPDFELPNFDEVETLRELEYELSKVDLSWWSLEVEKV